MKRETNRSAKGWSQVLIAVLLITLCAPLAVAAAWVEGSNPVFAPPAGVYYPSVLYDADAFSGHGAPYPYKLWYSNGSATAVGLAASNDGLSWTVLSSAVTGLASPHHVQVLYDAGGFGGSGYSYRIWYWCQSSSIYDIGSIHTAVSADGVTWSNDQALTQFGASVIVDNGTNWNRGSYGPIALIYNAAGSATLDEANIFNNKYVMYYDGTTGSQEAWGLAYSTDGILWKGYNGGLTPVLPTGGAGAWDQNYATHGSVVHSRYTSSWDAWYGGGITASSEGIGHATSPDGIVWTRDPANPLTDLGCASASSGLGCAGTWNATRNYTPVVLAWPSGSACPARDLKMWRSGMNAAGDKALGFASAVSPAGAVRNVPVPYATIQAAVTASNPGDTVQIAAGTFTENVVVDRPIELAGAGAGATILVPALSNPDCGGAGGSDPLCAGASSVILVQSGCVTIRDLTVDGDNPSLPGGVTVNGANVDARNGIILNGPLGPFDYFTVRDCQVKNIYLRGIYAYQPSSASLKPHLSLRGNTVDNVAGSADFSIGIFSRYSTGTIENNTVTNCPDAISANWSRGLQFLNNTVAGSGSGVHTDNAGSTPGDPSDVLRGNVVSSGVAFGGYPIYGVWAFNPYSPVTIANNTVDGADIGLAVHGSASPSGVVAFSGNAVNGSAKAGSRGALVSTDLLGWGSASASATFTGDRLQACAKGLEVDQQAGYASLAAATGATITGNATGVLVNGSTVSVTGSDLSSNSSSGVDNAGGTAVATCNWWGNASGPTTALNPGGSGSAVTGPATFAPWWTNATGPCDGTIATHLAFTVQPPASAQAGQALTPAVAVQVLDASNALCTHFNGTITLALSGGEPSAVLSGGSATVLNGVATFAALTVDQAGTSYQLTASFTGLTPALSEAFDILCGVPSVVYVDNAWTGLPNGTSVTADGGPHVIGCDAFATVQLAVNGVSDNGTIHVAAGTYTGTINIENRHAISILGAGRDTTIFQPASTLLWNVGNPSFDSRHTSIRVVGSTGINLSGVTLDQIAVRGSLVYGLLYWNATGTLDTNRYTHTSPPDLSNYSFVAHVRAVDAPYSASNRASVSFTNSEFTDTGRVAINVHNWVHLTISGNSFRNNVTQPDTFGYAMEIGSTATGTISGNTISGYNVPANDNSESAGIYIESAFTTDLRGGPVIPKPVTVTNNEIYGCQYGAWIGLGYAGLGGPVAIATSFSGNRVHDIAPSVPGQPSGGLLMEDVDRTFGSSNTLSASGNSFSAITGPAYRFFTAGDGELHAAVTGDVMTGCTAGFVAEEGAGATSHVSVYDLAFHFCRIAGNTSAAQNLLPSAYPTPIPAQNNWWGCNFGPGGMGTGCTGANGVSGAITVDPWLVLALGASPDVVGFGETSTLLADFFKDNHGVTVVGGTIPDGTPVAFAGTLGTVADPLLPTAGGHASTVFTAGTVGGTDGASTMVDGQTLTDVTVQNPAPTLISMTPSILAPGQPDFTLTVTGTNFVSGATVYFGGVAMTTAFGSATQLTALIPAVRVASVGSYPVQVKNPTPNAGDSDALNFAVAIPNPVWVDGTWAGHLPGDSVGGHLFGYDAFATIQAGVNAVASGGTVYVAAGTYLEEVVVARGILLHGAGIDVTVLMGRKNANPRTTLAIAGNAVTVEGFTITRDGNNPTDWAGNYKDQGVQFNQGVSGSTLRYCKITGNRNGVYINNAQGNTIRNNVIDFNRTGIHLVNNVAGTVITQNTITNNWTLGIIFNTVWGGETSATTGLAVSNNNVSGNWYSQVECRWNLSTATLDVSGNWLGSSTLVVLNSDVSEPGYASQIPVEYGGTATNPGGAASVGGHTSDRIDYTPWLNSGTDTDPGTIGFQGDFSYLNVGAVSPQSGATPRIAEAIGLLTSPGTVNLTAGTFTENVVVNKPLTLQGGGELLTTIVPALSAPNTCSGASLCPGSSNIILVQANNVTVQNMTLDGDNPLLNSGIVRGGADLDARNGIITDHTTGTYANLEVHHCTVKNIYLRGMYASTSSTFNFHHDTVTNVRGDGGSIGMFAWGGPGTMADNTVSYCNDAISANHSKGIQFLRNTVTNSASGIHTDNSGDGGGVADLIQGNTVTDGVGGYGIWTFVPYLAPTVEDNIITNCDIGLSAWGQGAAVTHIFQRNTVTGNHAAGSVGVYITTDTIGWGYTDIAVDLQNNFISGYETGIYLTADPQEWNPGPWVTHTINATINNNSITDNTAWVDKGSQPITATATCNWWGTADAAVIVPKLSGILTFAPWLVDGADTSADPGFQPVPGSCTGCIPPDATITAATAVCAGSTGNTASVPLVAGNTYAWTITNGAITSSTNTASIAYTAGATGPVTLGVTVTITATSCHKTGSVEVTVNPIPVATITPSGPTAFCQGGSVTLDAGSHGSYLWSTGATTQTITASTSGSYSVTVTDLGCTSAPSAATVVTVMATPPAFTYVDDGYVGLSAGTLVDWPYTGAGTHIIGCDAFATVQGGMDAVASGGTVNVAAGSYAENLLVSKPLSLLGPNTGKAGYALDRGSEAILYPASVGYDFNLPSALTILRIVSPDVTVDGFKLDGDNPDLPGGISMGGANVDAASGVSNWASNSDTWGARLFRVHVQNNILTHFSYIAMELDGSQQPAGDNLVQNNLFTNLDPGVTPVYKVGIGIYTGWNLYTDIVGNHFTDVRRGVQIENNSSANPGATMIVENNEVHSWRVGIWYNLHYGSASPITLQDNRMFAEATSTSNVGLRLTSLSGSIIPTVKNNDVTGGWVGMEAWNVPTSGPVIVEGGTIAGAETGVWFTNYEDPAPDGSNGYKSASNGDASLLVKDLTISGSTVRGIYVQDSPLNVNASKQVTLTANTTDVDGGASATGLLADGPKAAAAAATCAFRSGSSGVVALNGGAASVTYSDLSGNSSFGANNLNAGGTPVLAAACDWWGDASGPTNPANPPGTGTVASSNVTFAPWSTIDTPPYNCEGCVNASITTQPASTAVCSGGETTLSVVAGGTGLSYQWYQGTAPDTSTPLGTASTQATGNLTVTTSYWVRVTGFCGSPVNSATATVTVNPLPGLTSMTPNQLAPGQPAFTMTLTGSDFDSSAVVTFNGVDMTTDRAGAPTQLTAAIPETAVAAAGAYPVQVRNSTGCTSNVLTFTVTAPSAVWADDDWVGLAPGTVVSVTVPSAGNHTIGYDAFAAVQGGIDAVANPGTEYVLPGTYQERLQISKSVNIRGPNADLNPNSPGAWGPEAILDSKSHGVALDFLKTGSSGTVLNGLTWRQEDAANIVLSKWSGINNVVIRDNWFDTNVSSAIQLEGGFSGSNWRILDNKVTTVTGGGPAFTLYNLTSSTVSGNSVANTASGFLLTSVTGTQISNNTFSGIGGVNVQISTGCGSLTVGGPNALDGNTVTGNGTTSTGVQLFGGLTGTVNVTHNVIHGCAAGVAVPTGQNITGLDIHVNTNDLSSNAYGASNTGTGNLDATCNWWGSGMGPTHATNPYPGTGAPVTNNVTFAPWSTATPPLYNCDGQIRCMNPTFASASPLPAIQGAVTEQILTLTNPAGSAMPTSFSFTWPASYVVADFGASAPAAPLGYWQEMRPYGSPFVPTALYPMLWISGTSAYVDVDGNGTYQPGTDYLVTETGNTISVTRTVTPSGTVESQSVGYRMILQSPLVQNPDATGDFAIAATLSSDCLSAWNGSAIETIEPQGSGCAPPDTLKDVGSTVRVTKSGSSFTIAWSPDPAPVSCMEGYVVLASSDCRAFSAFAPLATVDKNTAQVAAGTGLNVTYFLVAEVGQGGEIGPTGWVAP